MQKIYFVLLILFPSSLFAQSYDYSIGQQLEKLDSISEKIYAYQQLGSKYTGSDALNHARDWIVTELQRSGYSDIELDSFTYSGHTLQNIIVEKAGLDTQTWIILGAHYDSYPGSPGANDNGTGVVSLLQIARIMHGIETEVGVRFVFFSAEENGFIGSKHYVANRLNASQNLQLMLNLDQLGGTLNADNSMIHCERDETMTPSFNNELSDLKTDTLAKLVRVYSTLTPVKSKAYSSDYIPFQDSGYTITGLYQYSNYPFYHQSNDMLSNMDIQGTKEVMQVALAAAMYFSRNTLPLSEGKEQVKQLRLYPNPSSNHFNLKAALHQRYELKMYNYQMQVVLQSNVTGSEQIDVQALPQGVYFVQIYDERSSEYFVSKLIIAR